MILDAVAVLISIHFVGHPGNAIFEKSSRAVPPVLQELLEKEYIVAQNLNLYTITAKGLCLLQAIVELPAPVPETKWKMPGNYES